MASFDKPQVNLISITTEKHRQLAPFYYLNELLNVACRVEAPPTVCFYSISTAIYKLAIQLFGDK